MTDTDTETAPEVDLASIDAKVDYLSSLFERRLLADKEKQRAYADLQARLESAETVVAGMHLAPLARELFVIVDRVDRYGGEDLDFARSIGGELLESLRRHGISEVEVTQRFDPEIHEVGSTVEAPDGITPGSVIGIHRRGFRCGDKLLRPASVKMASGGSDDEAGA